MLNHQILPEVLSAYIEGGPIFATSITECQSGHEVRVANWKKCKMEYTLFTEIMTSAEKKVLLNFFMAHNGRAIPFLFKDLLDYNSKITYQAMGGEKELNLYKKYTFGENFYQREILYINARSLKVISNQLSIMATFSKPGKIFFDRALTKDETITIEFEFYVPVRFSSDTLALSNTPTGYNEIKLTEVKE